MGDIGYDIMIWVINNFISQTMLLLALIVMIGLIAMRKPFYKILIGMTTTMIGYQIFNNAGSITFARLGVLKSVVVSVFPQVPPFEWRNKSLFVAEASHMIMPIMAFGYFLHVGVIRFLPKDMRNIWLNGMLTLRLATWTACAAIAANPAANPFLVIIFGTVICAFWYTFQPIYMLQVMKVVTGDPEGRINYAHQSSTCGFITAYVSRFIGDPTQTAENMEFPWILAWMRDTQVASTVIYMAIFLGLALIAGPVMMAPYVGDMNYIMWAIQAGVYGGTGSILSTYGTRTMMAEILPAFEGISTKVVPGARPALDVPVVFAYGPTAMLIGGAISTAVGWLTFIVFAQQGWGMINPSTGCLFMSGCGIAVMGNAFGGWKGAVFGGVFNGLWQAIGNWGMINAWGVPMVVLSSGMAGGEPDDYLLMPLALFAAQAIF